MSFEVIPAIDLRGGRCVRLFQGDYARETVYGDDPAAMARHWCDLGATRLHVVDLDGARSGEPVNAEAVRSIIDAVDVPVELGGGVRDMGAIEGWLTAGVQRVYLGTAAITDHDLVIEACSRFPGQVAAAADARDGRIAVSGWQVESAEDVVDFARRMLSAGVTALTYTNVSLDGTGTGADVPGVQRLIEALGATETQIILAGGIGSLEDITRAAGVSGLSGVVVGRALYEGTVDLPAALAAAAGLEELAMSITTFDHYTVRSGDVEASRRFYAEVLGLNVRDREGAAVPAIIVSIGDKEVVHVFQATAEMESVFARMTPTDGETALWRTGRLHHVEFWGTGLAEMRQRFQAHDATFSERTLPDKHQVGLRDQDGIVVNVNFALSELPAGS